MNFFYRKTPPSVADPNNTYPTHPQWSCPWVGKYIDMEIGKDTVSEYLSVYSLDGINTSKYLFIDS